jgi:exosortase
MSAKNHPAAPLPTPFLGALIVAAAFMAFTAWDQTYWWRTKEDYGFGWLVPLFVAYVVYDRWPKVMAQLFAVEASPEIAGTGNRWGPRLLTLAASIALAGGSLLFLSGAFYRAAAGVTHLSSLAIATGMAGAVLAAIYFLSPTRSASSVGRATQRWSMTTLFLFPVLVWLVSAPLLTSVDTSLALYLMHKVTSIVFVVFDGLGLTLEQHGNVLILPSGSVGVEEACSGVRSLTGCLFAGSFLAAVFVRSYWRKLWLMIASLLFAFGANLLRSIFLTSWAYYHGAKSIEGTIHDASGYAVLGIAVVALLCLLPIIDRRPPPTAQPSAQ